jgi:uracil-xanthine permease
VSSIFRYLKEVFSWTEVQPADTRPVAPNERLAWGKTIGLGAQHVMAMFGGTFVFPVLMGLSPNLAIMLSGVATLAFMLIVGGKVPSYLGTSAAFVGGAAAIYSHQGADASDVTGAVFVCGVVLALVGVIIHFFGADVINAVLPPIVTGGVVMLIGFNLAGVSVVTDLPSDPWMAIITMLAVVVFSVALKGFLGRIAIFLGLLTGYVLSWLADLVFGKINTQFYAGGGAANSGMHNRVDWSGVKAADWFGFPKHSSVSGLSGGEAGWHLPSLHITFILLMLPAVIALVAENVGHVKAVADVTETDLDAYMGRAVIGDGVGTALSSFFGGGPSTTYAENIGVMATTKVYSTAAYLVAAIVAILLGFVPKFGAIVNATPPAVLGGVTMVLYGMIGILGAKIWKENNVNLGNPINLVPVAAGLIMGIGLGTSNLFKITDNFTLGGIAMGTLIIVIGYHLCRYIAVAEHREAPTKDATPSAGASTGATTSAEAPTSE